METLQKEIDTAARTVRTDHYDLSIGELASMYEADEIQINPVFQRLFRWKIDQKARLIESILLSIPLPSIFVFEREDNVWELIDGLQRLSTIFELMGILKDPDTGEPKPLSVLVGTKYLPLLDGVVWEDPAGDRPSMSRGQQIAVKRARISVEILRRGTDEKSKFDLFQRLNGGGSPLTAQEMRNCIILMYDADLHAKIMEIADDATFLATVQRSKNQMEKQEHVEYVVRLLVYTFVRHDKRVDVQPYLDDGVLQLSDIERERGIDFVDMVREVFALINESVGPNGLKRFDNGQFLGRVGLVGLEVIAAGIAHNLTAIQALDEPVRFLEARIREFWEHPEASSFGRAGVRGSDRLGRTLPFGQHWFDPSGEP